MNAAERRELKELGLDEAKFAFVGTAILPLLQEAEDLGLNPEDSRSTSSSG
jgi:hypothetical protein